MRTLIDILGTSYRNWVRIGYAFVSSKLAATLDNVSTYQDRHIREVKISDHSPLVINCNLS